MISSATKFFALFLIIAFPLTTQASYRSGDDQSVQISTANEENYYAAGDFLNIDFNIADDLYAVGRIIEINQPIGGDLVAAGESVDLLAPIEDDVRIAGQTLKISSTIGDQLVALGEMIIIRSTGVVGGDAWLTGNTIEVLGPIEGDIIINADRVHIKAEIGGNAEINAREVKIEGGGFIQGNLSTKGKSTITPEKVGGEIYATESKMTGSPHSFEHRAKQLFDGFSFVMLLSSLLIGALLMYLLQPFWKDFSDSVRTKPFVNFGIGILSIILIPILSIILMVTFVGLPIGFILLFAYLATLIFVCIIDGLALGAFFFPSTKKPDFRHLLGSFVLGSILLFLLSLLPIIGWLIKFIVFVLAFGAILNAKWQLFGVLRKAKKV